MEIILGLSTLVSAIAAVLAWVAKIRWSNEFAKAKDETIKAKEAQIEVLDERIQSLKELSPMKLREYYLTVKEQLEEYNNQLQSKLAETEKELSDMKDSDTLQINTDEHLQVTKAAKLLKLIREMDEINKKRARTDQAMLSSE